jgi:hypothetical protein
MTDYFHVAEGIARAFLFGIFTVSATGKLAGCQAGSSAMCRKAALDAGIAATALLPWLTGACVAGLAGAGIAVIGLFRELVRKNTVCNCFGVLTTTFDAWRNRSRIAMFASGVIMLVCAERPAATEEISGALLAGLAGGLALVLVIAVYAMAAKVPVPGRGRLITAADNPDPATLQLDQASAVGIDATGMVVSLGELARAGQPLALLFSSPGCGQCELLKSDFEPLLEEFPFPLYIVVEAGLPDGGLTSHALYDATGAFRRALPLTGVPSMIVIDTQDWKLRSDASRGADMIRRDLLRMLVRGARSPAQPANNHQSWRRDLVANAPSGLLL